MLEEQIIRNYFTIIYIGGILLALICVWRIANDKSGEMDRFIDEIDPFNPDNYRPRKLDK